MPFAMPTAMQVDQGGPPSHSSTETAQQSSGEHQAYSNIYGYPRSTPEQSSTSTSQSPYHGQAHGFPSSSTSSWALMDWSDYSRPSEQPTFGTSPSLVAGRPRYAEQTRPHLYPAQQLHQQLHQQPYKPTSPSSSSSSPSFGPPPPSASSSTSSSAALRGGYQMDTPLLPAPSSSDAHLLPSSYPPAAHSALPNEAYDSYQPHPSSQYHQPPSNPSGWPQQPQRPFGGFAQQPAPPHQPIRTRSDPVADLSFADRRPAPSSSVSAPLPPTTMAVSNPGGSSSLPYTAYISPGPPEHLGHYQKATVPSGPKGDESDSSYTAVNGPSSSSKPGPAAGGSKGSESRGTSRTRVATSQKMASCDDDKQARRREQNRTAQRAYKARQNKHVEEVEIRNKELEIEVRQQRDLLLNMRDLLMRCQQENDVLRRVLKPLEPSDDDLASPTRSPCSRSPRPPSFSSKPSSSARDGLQEILDTFAIRPAPSPSERRIPDDARRRADEERYLHRLRERYEPVRVRIAAVVSGDWASISSPQRTAAGRSDYSTGQPPFSTSSSSLLPTIGNGRLKVEGGHADSVSPPLRSPHGDNCDRSADQRHGSSRTSQMFHVEGSWTPGPDDDSPINDDDLQELLGPRYWEHGTQLMPPPPRIPLRGIWREIKTAAPDVSKDDIDIDLLCTSLRRSTFCDGIEPCIPQPAFRYIIEHVVEQSKPNNASHLAAPVADVSSNAE